MTINEFLEYLRQGNPVTADTDMHQYMHQLAQAAMLVTNELNNAYHEQEEIVSLFSRIIGKPVQLFDRDLIAVKSPAHRPAAGSAKVKSQYFLFHIALLR